MIQKISGFFDRSLAITISTRGDKLGCLFSDFLESKIAICQKPLSVGGRLANG
jgi:hypothetical protein